MQIVVDWYISDKVILMTCSRVVEVSDLVKGIHNIADKVDQSRAKRVYLIIDVREMKKIPGLIELLSIKVSKRDKFEDIIIVGLQYGMLRMPIVQVMRAAKQTHYFVKHLQEAEKLINSKEVSFYDLPLLPYDEEDTANLSNSSSALQSS